MAKKDNVASALEETISALEKKYGQGVVLRTDDTPTNVKAIPTGSFAIDNLLGCGGLPVGRLIEIYGQESSGKSTLCLFFAAQMQKQGKKIVYLDVEQSYDRRYAELIGVDTDKLIVSQPSSLEETFDILRAFVASGEVDLIILDSVAALVPAADFEEGNLEKDSMAVKARLMSKYLPVVNSEISKSNTICVFINQTRANIGVYYGPKDTTPGGKALKFFASVRLSVTKGEAIKSGDSQIGNVMKIVAKKNKVGFPFREATVDLYYGSGVDLIKDTFDAAVAAEVIEKTGNTYIFNKDSLGVGRNNASSYLKEHLEILAEVRKALSSAAIPVGTVVPNEDDDSDE